MAYHVLSMDGGPSAPLYIANLLALERWQPGFLARVDHFVGSSAGAIAAAYLATQLPESPTTEQSQACLQGCLDFVNQCFVALEPTSDDAYLQFLLGKTALSSSEPLEAALHATLGNLRLADVPRPFSCQGGRMDEPWGPQVLSNTGDVPENPTLVSAVLRSSSGPMCLPIHQIHVDGFVYTNNPAMSAVTRMVKHGVTTLADLVILAAGGDDGSSSLSNIFLPQNDLRFDQRAMPKPVSDLALQLDGAELELLSDHYHHLAEAMEGLAERAEKLGLKLTPDALGPDESNWGWLAWLAYLPNPVYLLQVLFSSAGRGVTQQLDDLVGERSFRLAPMGLMTSNVGFLLIALRQSEIVAGACARTAALWQDRITNALLDFQPTVPATLRWVEQTWMKA